MESDFAHGSPWGYENGCTSRGGCRYDRSDPYLSCVEAQMARRRDFGLRRLPVTQPIPRVADDREPGVPEAVRGEVHGTPWGYRRGCRTPERCPHWNIGKVTCAEAKRRYHREYGARRLAGEGAPVEHGSVGGYELGCRDRRCCPGDEQGVTCADARAEQRLRAVRAQGVRPRRVDGRDAVRRMLDLERSGHSLREIARLAGIGRATVSEILREHRRTGRLDLGVSPTTAAAILAVPVPDPAPAERELC